jgi:vacuolar-type H+-ATPase subunit H
METSLEVLDRLDDVLRRHCQALPAPHRQRMEREVLGLVQMVRSALPRELAQAARLLDQAEATLARAREDARRVLLDAESRARMLGEHGRPAPPTARGQAIIDEALREAERVRRGAEDYAATVLEQLATDVDRVLHTIRRGQDALRPAEGARPGGV